MPNTTSRWLQRYRDLTAVSTEALRAEAHGRGTAKPDTTAPPVDAVACAVSPTGAHQWYRLSRGAVVCLSCLTAPPPGVTFASPATESVPGAHLEPRTQQPAEPCIPQSEMNERKHCEESEESPPRGPAREDISRAREDSHCPDGRPHLWIGTDTGRLCSRCNAHAGQPS
jgi:hypothetical protein